MPGKRKASGKAKKPAYLTADEDLAPFGFKVKDIVRTPLGLTGTVIGVKYKKVSEADHVHRDIKLLEADEAAWEVRKKELTEEAAKKAAAALEPEKKGKDKKK